MESAGLYLLIQEPAAAFESERTALAVVVRRRDDPVRATDVLKGTPTVTVYAPLNDTTAALATYDALANTGAVCEPSGESCYAQLSVVMNIAQYLRYMAFATWIGLGDYIDELFLYSSAELQDSRYWSLNLWDTGATCDAIRDSADSFACRRRFRVQSPRSSRLRLPPLWPRHAVGSSWHLVLLRGRAGQGSAAQP